MKNDVFRKDIEPRCAYCEYANTISDTQVICSRKGVMACTSHCRRFRYDPLRRNPPEAAVLNKRSHNAEDFSI